MGGGEETAWKNRHGTRTDVARESGRGTKGQRSQSEQRQNDKKKNLHKLWTNRCSDQGIDTAGRGQEGG